MKRKKKWKRRC